MREEPGGERGVPQQEAEGEVKQLVNPQSTVCSNGTQEPATLTPDVHRYKQRERKSDRQADRQAEPSKTEQISCFILEKKMPQNQQQWA